ncbi:hypothetical protein D7W82_13865 [Corallococcus sp. CA049B]|uniref:hypothetical protein n=1 Tax=Corallococcus sp. CA049B TaxID=2316730 RepID=UPI000ED01400|nr:hypothetical protein [Corallococcus sp. CA049B]RKG87292.1 hypothetical protein D7W82_13865 [Corallococcus sp. CA049B]
MRRTVSGVLLALAAMAMGCGEDLQAPDVSSVRATRLDDGRVSLDVFVTCFALKGQQPADEDCGLPEDEPLCVDAGWYLVTDAAFSTPLFSQRTCEPVGTVIRRKMTVVSPGVVPAEHDWRILVQVDPRSTRIIIASP